MTDKPVIEKLIAVKLPEPILGKHWQTFMDASQAYRDQCEKKKIVAIDAYCNFMGARKLVQDSVVRLEGPGASALRKFLDMDDPQEVPAMIIGAVDVYIATPLRAGFFAFLAEATSLAALLGITLPKSEEETLSSPSN